MSSEPLISIITVVFNGEKYLEQTISSVLNQTYKNIEYLIIDGGSTDGTLDIIKRFEHHIDYWITEPDRGLYDAMNKGISIAQGEFIGMINSDDWYEANAVELIVEDLRHYPTKKIYHGDRFDISKNGTKRIRKFNHSQLKFLFYGMTYNHPSMFVHRDIYLTDRYNIKLKSLSDYEFVLKQYLRDKSLFSYIPFAYVNYRLDGISSKLKIKELIIEGFRARRNAGLPWFQNSLSATFRCIIFLIFEFRASLKAKVSILLQYVNPC